MRSAWAWLDKTSSTLLSPTSCAPRAVSRTASSSRCSPAWPRASRRSCAATSVLSSCTSRSSTPVSSTLPFLTWCAAWRKTRRQRTLCPVSSISPKTRTSSPENATVSWQRCPTLIRTLPFPFRTAARTVWLSARQGCPLSGGASLSARVVLSFPSRIQIPPWQPTASGHVTSLRRSLAQPVA